MATTSNPGPTEPRPTPEPDPAPQPGQPPGPPNAPPRPGQQDRPEQRLVSPDGRAWEPPPPPTPTQEELDAMATGEYDGTAPEGQRIKRRSMEGQSGTGYPTR